MNVKRIEGALLNYWVAKSAGLKMRLSAPLPGERHDPDSGEWHPQNYHPASDWSQGGGIVSNEWYVIEDTLTEWFGSDWHEIKAIMDAPLPWFMRAYVASQFGDTVEDIAGADAAQAPSPVLHARLQLNSLRALRPLQWMGAGRD